MSFQLRKAVLSDTPAITDAFYDAFDRHPVTHRVLMPRSESTEAFWSESVQGDIQDPQGHYFVVTDPASATPERIIAFGKWREPVTAASSPPPPIPSWPEGGDVVFAELFFGMVKTKHDEIMGERPHWYLEILGVRKEYQGRGVGRRLVEWGVSKADEDGVEGFLAASPFGFHLYAKYGFEIVEKVEVDIGAAEPYVERFMLRKAKDSPA
ncbi:acyl-CoA N-acyltransferase [Durotheca rogersii]|uniref:acyl-CoA N-acyltransferase n=1 Tax=Durotheca rogersii TaxID=419775 RepID=UPI00221F04BD|nr:acyl-CoA N-acyltransferase [Durotheca rogersii]KAI5857482.1 acyl-CoA N-acyltransferase [Durotheca rogersii]